MSALKRFLDIFLPRFVTEWVVLIDAGDQYDLLCALHDLDEWEFDTSMRFQKWRSFNLFGYAIMPKAIGGIYQADSYEDLSSLPDD